MKTIREILIAEIDREESLKSVADAAQMTYSSLHGFVHSEADIRLSNVERLADYFGLVLMKKRNRRG